MYAHFLRRGFSLFTVHRRVGTADIWNNKDDWKKNLIREITERGFEFAPQKVLEEFDQAQKGKTDPSFVRLWEDDEDTEGAYEGHIKLASEEKRK